MNFLKKKLKVSHFAQVPCEPFEFEVKDEIEAKRIMTILSMQHLFLEKQRIIPDYSNVMMVSMWEDDSDGEGNAGWSDYYNEEEGMDWEEFEEAYLESEKPVILTQ